MRAVLVFCVSVLTPLTAYCQPKLHPKAGALTTYSTQIVPLVIVGEGWSQRIVLTNVDDSLPAAGTIQFYTQTGATWTLSTAAGNSSIFTFALQPGQTYLLDTLVSQAPQTLGWAMIQETSSALGSFLGQTIFRKQTAGLPDFMCSHVLGGQAYSRLSVFFDNTGGNYSGMGILTSQVCLFSCDVADSLRVSVRDLSGNIVSQKNHQPEKRSAVLDEFGH